jgi:phosphoserine phosphatase RsbU/P
MRFRVPFRTTAARREPLPGASPALEPSPSAAGLLLHSRAGRLFIGSAIAKLLFAAVRRMFPGAPAFVDLLGGLATLGLLASLFYFLWRLFVLMKRRLLWRVRRKLILSYIFIGAVPALLIISFFLLAGVLVSMNISAYLFKDAYDGVVEDIRLASQSVSSQVAEHPRNVVEILERTRTTLERRYPGVAIAVVGDRGSPAAVTGTWEHQRPPAVMPKWLAADGFAGTVAVLGDEADQLLLVIRGVQAIKAPEPAGVLGWVVVDLPVDKFLMDMLRESTGVKGIPPRFSATESQKPDNTLLQGPAVQNAPTEAFSILGNSLAFIDTHLWSTGEAKGATVSMRYEVGELWTRLVRVQSRRVQFGNRYLADIFMLMLGLVTVLFLIIQGVALVMGLALARSITSSIHELFTGTERVRHGDFTHRIRVYTKDQLGELAESFNQMTGSIEGLLQTAAEKKRMEEELRIARQIQMSLLPRGPLDYSGIGVTALCVPAREVGGDYYDFFHLPDGRLGVLIADVAGKGTSAALYMAELKGLMLALSQTIASPAALLREVNRIISENLDSRSFITMTYAVVDRQGLTMTYCRAGHTPLIYLPGPASPSGRGVKTLTPDGMVVGLRIPGASEKFDELLEQDSLTLSVGDVIVFYTDGISEAMNSDSDLFGENRLGRIVEEHGHLDSGELRERILREIESFVGSADQHDDMTMILLKVEEMVVEAVAV